jgi:hypothetical protein
MLHLTLEIVPLFTEKTISSSSAENYDGLRHHHRETGEDEMRFKSTYIDMSLGNILKVMQHFRTALNS